MSSSSQEIVYEGWLTKSPPSKRIWRAKWRRRWFALRQSGELPGQYYLDYYADRNCRKLKGRIDLDLCDQVDAGLCMERGGGALGSGVRGSVFSVRTAARTYHLEADCEADMKKWVDAICRVCGLRAEQTYNYGDEEISLPASGPPSNPEPYIRISECITGVPGQDSSRARSATLYAQRIIASNNNIRRVGQGQLSDAAINVTGSHKFLRAEGESQTLDVAPVNNGPPVPPRPRSTFRLIRNGTNTDRMELGPQGVKYTTGREMTNEVWGMVPNRSCYMNASCASGGTAASAPSAAAPLLRMPLDDFDDFDMDEDVQGHNSSAIQYTNMLTIPPAVDRALKPRHSSLSSGQIHNLYGNQVGRGGDYRWSPSTRRRAADQRNSACVHKSGRRMERDHTLQYLDLDLPSPKPSTSREFSPVVASHSKTQSASEDPDSAYKTVDFLKTEAFNITRMDAEALRSKAMAL